MSKEEVNFEMKLQRDEKIGFYKRHVRPSHLGDFWESKDFLSFLESGTGLTLRFRSSQGQTYGPGDYSLLHSEELERKIKIYMFLMRTIIIIKVRLEKWPLFLLLM